MKRTRITHPATCHSWIGGGTPVPDPDTKPAPQPEPQDGGAK